MSEDGEWSAKGEKWLQWWPVIGVPALVFFGILATVQLTLVRSQSDTIARDVAALNQRVASLEKSVVRAGLGVNRPKPTQPRGKRPAGARPGAPRKPKAKSKSDQP